MADISIEKGWAMRTLGLLGGMSWESSAVYYKLINEAVRAHLGGLHSAPLLLDSQDFAPIAALQSAGAWDQAGQILAERAAKLEQAGAEGIVLCTNTMHKVADAIRARIGIPFLHLAEATAQRIVAAGHRSVALLGTRFTMQQPFYREVLEAYGLTVLLPDDAGCTEINRVIYEELCQGRIESASRAYYVTQVEGLAQRGAECVILGCTEITLLVQAPDLCVPAFDTTAIHAQAAADFALGLV
jgi:aspartate racemase